MIFALYLQIKMDFELIDVELLFWKVHLVVVAVLGSTANTYSQSSHFFTKIDVY